VSDAPARERPGRWSRRVVGPFTLGQLAVVGLVLLGGALLLVLLGTPVRGPTGSAVPVPGSGFYRMGEPTTGPAVGQRAPELEGTVDGRTVPLTDLDGEVVSLAARRGRPVWLSFFATWCPPCQEETPVLRAAHDRYAGDGLEMIAVSVQETTPDDVRAWAETYGLAYPIGFDASSAVFRAYGGFGLPTHVFIDRDGVVRRVVYGPLTSAEVDGIVAPLLAEAG
jgi:cytochrome c biogenesis protein CcmG, thiol:disulfide interchange protein DsbE